MQKDQRYISYDNLSIRYATTNAKDRQESEGVDMDQGVEEGFLETLTLEANKTGGSLSKGERTDKFGLAYMVSNF